MPVPPYGSDVTIGSTEEEVYNRIRLVKFSSARIQLLLRMIEIVIIMEVEDMYQFLSINITVNIA